MDFRYFRSRIVLTIIGFILFAVACRKDVEIPSNSVPTDHEILSRVLNLPESPFPYDYFDIPAPIKDNLLSLQDNMPDSNTTTPWGATLGRVLFYDPMLSKNNTISCSSCHQQDYGFSDPNRFSIGFENGETGRHSMGLANARYYANGKFFWDERAATLEDQVLMPIQDPVEMGMTLDHVVSRLTNTDHYPVLFRKAFGNETISADRISKALAQFVRSIVSYQSKFDEGLALANYDRVTDFSNFTTSENMGKKIFFTNLSVPCAGCHMSNAIVSDSPRNNGVMDGDLGAFEFNAQEYLKGAFKAPSLRNIAIRPPYMHNGTFPNLMAVIDHYNSGLGGFEATGSLDPHLLDASNMPARMNLTPLEKQSLVDFLHTLTDNTMATNEVYSTPFR